MKNYESIVESFKDDNKYYGDTKYVSCSMLKKALKSPRELRDYLEFGSESSEAFSFGNAFHTLLLEPEKFRDKFFILDINLRPEPNKTMASTANKKWKVEELENATKQGKILISDKDLDKIDSMISSLQKHKDIIQILKESKREVAHVWIDPITGIKCKGKFDLESFDYLSDVKTCAEVDDVDKFRYECYKYNYDMQAAFYCDSKGLDQFKFIVVEKKPPFKCAIFDVSEEFLESGRRKYRRALEIYDKYFVSCELKINDFTETGTL